MRRIYCLFFLLLSPKQIAIGGKYLMGVQNKQNGFQILGFKFVIESDIHMHGSDSVSH